MDERLLERLLHLRRVLDAFIRDTRSDVVEDLFGCRDAGIGADQQLFKLLPKLFVDVAAREDAGDLAEPGALRPL